MYRFSSIMVVDHDFRLYHGSHAHNCNVNMHAQKPWPSSPGKYIHETLMLTE